MALDEQLLKCLFDLRADIRKENLFSDGGMPTVCTDDALNEMATTVPETLDALCGIPGLGIQFKHLYAERFLAAIREYIANKPLASEAEKVNDKVIDDGIKETLRDLSRKLSNLSKTNSMLHHVNISGEKVKAFDLSAKGLDLRAFMAGGKIVICDYQSDDEGYQVLEKIISIARRAQRDVGQNELYIAYPYVIGNLKGIDFTIRAPLALFPVILEKERSKMTISFDKNRDVLMNNSLITAYEYTVNDYSNKPLGIDVNSVEDLIAAISAAYAEVGIDVVDVEDKSVKAFEEFSSGDNISNREGLEVSYRMVLGRFTNSTSALQRDYSLMAEAGNPPATVKELVENIGLKDFYFEAQSTDDSVATDCSESSLHYINALNSAQEEILGDMEDNTTMVIQGPPGTGKSQVITSIIGSAALAGKTVLVMAEKKTALEVIRSRLGPISRYGLLIDDSQDKNTFYAQMAAFMEERKLPDEKDTTRLSGEIQQRLDKLSQVSRIYAPSEFGPSACDIYMKGKWVDTVDKGIREELANLRKNILPEIIACKYEDLLSASRDLADRGLAEKCYKHFKNLSDMFVISSVKPGLTEMQFIDMSDEARALMNSIKVNAGSGFFAKLKGSKASDDAKKAFASKYLVSAPADDNAYLKLLEILSKDDFIETYRKHSTIEETFSNLSDTCKLYSESMFRMAGDSLDNFMDANGEILKYVEYNFISGFDAETIPLRATMESYDSTMNEIAARMDDKMKVLRINAEAVVGRSVEGLRKSKSAVNIRGVMDSENRQNLNRFMNRNIDSLLNNVKIWLMTPETVSELLPLRRGLFDYLIIDEASQLKVEKAIPAIYRAKKLIISGDHKQLRPSSKIGDVAITYSETEDIEDDDDVILEQESLLDLARIRYETYFLNFHYRSRYEELIAFSNAAFYKGKLYVSPNVRKPSEPPIEYINVHGITEKDRSGNTIGNKVEAEHVVSIIRDILTGVKGNHGSIGVITFNGKQADLVCNALDDACAKDAEFARLVNEEKQRVDYGENRSLFINTIENVQGDERDIIIFCVGYAKDKSGNMRQNYGYVNQAGGENRVNVAVTRAKSKIYVVASLEPDEFKVDNVSGKGPHVLVQYLRYCRAVSDGDTNAIKAALAAAGDIPEQPVSKDKVAMQKEIAEYLEKFNIFTDLNVGVSGYNIDIAVRGVDGYVLGIELDSSIYTKFGSTRERDIHRSKYLESRGWKTCRFWTPNYWTDKSAELARILKIARQALGE